MNNANLFSFYQRIIARVEQRRLSIKQENRGDNSIKEREEKQIDSAQPTYRLLSQPNFRVPTTRTPKAQHKINHQYL
ncbi:hypothetical protein K402DRAFT_395331, partial [Aulographum hederae CBS 113979]